MERWQGHQPQPVSVWIDDIYMSVPFLAQMGKLTGDRRYFDDAARQVIGMSEHLQDKNSGLFDHSWFESNPYDVKFYWGRGCGWALMATAELLSVLPEDHPDRARVLDIFRRAAQGVAAVQSGMGMWHQLLNREDSYLEASVPAPFALLAPTNPRPLNCCWFTPTNDDCPPTLEPPKLLPPMLPKLFPPMLPKLLPPLPKLFPPMLPKLLPPLPKPELEPNEDPKELPKAELCPAETPEPKLRLPNMPDEPDMPLPPICPLAAGGSLARAASRTAEIARVNRMIGPP